MVMDAISNGAAVPSLSKKKRASRVAKLKQSKLDVRREQWLSQVKDKGGKVDIKERCESPPSSMQAPTESNQSLHNSKVKSREECENMSHHDSDAESLMNSPSGSSFSHNDSRGLSGSSSWGGSSISSSSGNVSEEEDNGCLDSWEAIADALIADDNQNQPASGTPSITESTIELANATQPCKDKRIHLANSESSEKGCGLVMNHRAWRPDDALRPRSLPSLSTQQNFLINSWHCGHGAIPWAGSDITTQPSTCPICCEELDVTDSSFLPCSCGFRLCLFCHKRILEADGRCPGCRKHYETINGEIGCNPESSPSDLAHSCHTIIRL